MYECFAGCMYSTCVLVPEVSRVMAVMVVSHHVGTGNQTLVLCKSNHLAIFSALVIDTVFIKALLLMLKFYVFWEVNV